MKTLRKRLDAARSLAQYEERLINIKVQLSMIKTQIENPKTTIDADADFTQADKDEIQAASNLANNIKYTDFIAFIQNQVG